MVKLRNLFGMRGSKQFSAVVCDFVSFPEQQIPHMAMEEIYCSKMMIIIGNRSRNNVLLHINYMIVLDSIRKRGALHVRSNWATKCWSFFMTSRDLLSSNELCGYGDDDDDDPNERGKEIYCVS